MKTEDYRDIIKALQAPTANQVWEKAHYIDFGHELRGFRRDDLGYVIQKDAYGKRDSEYGWEIDHVHPSSLGGHDGLSNVRPLHWRANCAKADKSLLADLLNRLR